MKYVLVAIAALLIGAFVMHWWLGEEPEPVDPIHVIVTQLKTHAIVEHERQVAVWYRACPEVTGVNPQIFVAWPAKLSYELGLSDVRLERSGDRLKVRTAGINADEPAVPTDFLDYLSTEPLFNFANEQQLVNDEVRKASGIARYLSAYYLRNDPSLRADFARELQALVARLADALGIAVAGVDVEIAARDPGAFRLPKLDLCTGTAASVNGVPFAKDAVDHVAAVRFDPATPGTATGIASVYGAP
jgi:hypothetical protein